MYKIAYHGFSTLVPPGTKALKLERMTFHDIHGDRKKGMRDLLKTFAEMDKVRICWLILQRFSSTCSIIPTQADPTSF